MPDLTGVRAKLRRADEHRQAYDDLFARFLETQPYSILFEFDPESGWHVFRWLVTSEPPLEDLSLIFSDILGNLRSTLDYLVWQPVMLGGRKLPAAVLTAESFGYLINVADVPEGERFESQDYLDRPVENGGEVARFRTESRLMVDVHVNENPRFRLSFRDGVDMQWSPLDLIEWVREAIVRFEPAFYRGETNEVTA